jgi:hypothetical protein
VALGPWRARRRRYSSGRSFGHAPFDEQSTDDEWVLEHAARTAKTTASSAKAFRRRTGKLTLALPRDFRARSRGPRSG